MNKPRSKRPAQPPRRATPSRATTRSTAGPGYDFEDQVAAWIMVGMLHGAPLPIAPVHATEIRWQTRQQIDDLAVSAKDARGVRHTFALSCKSSVQVSANGLPQNFVEAAWLHMRAHPAINGVCHAVLVTRDNHPAFNALWTDIKGWCGEGPAEAGGRMAGSQKHAKTFSAMTQAVHRHDPEATQDDVIGFVQSIYVLSFDFQLASSKDWARTLAMCRAVLAGEDAQDGARLWEALLVLAKSKRHTGGTLDLTSLIATLRPNFALKAHPDYAASWAALRAHSNQRIALVETTLPSGTAVARRAERDKLIAALGRSHVTIVHGDSGVGKSALVLTSLRETFGDDGIVWLQGSDIERVLLPSEQTAIGLSQPLAQVLAATTQRSNCLVIDSAERMSDQATTFVAALLKLLCASGPQSSGSTWRVVVVTQSAALDTLASLRFAVATIENCLELGPIDAEDVRRALRSIPGLAWLASDGDAVAAMRNLKTLAWVVQAKNAFTQAPGTIVSRTTVAEHLWRHWTEERSLLQQLMIQMAEREAAFEPALMRRELAPAQLSEIDRLPPACPVMMTARGRLEFRHDLAADWSRYQRLREIGEDPSQWAAFASNPLWHSAIRMLGQELLRETMGQSTAWDQVYQQLEAAEGVSRSAADLLLDALCLDPLADRWLNERTGLLLGHNGKRLDRMLERFHHIATVPLVTEPSGDGSMRFYIEAMFRTPIHGRWGPIVRFLHRHVERVAPLGSAAVAKLCETWLKTTPVLLSGQPTYFRRELAEVAIAAARELQLELMKRRMIFDGSEQAIYAAAFAAAPDLPDEVAAWALEMARRRPARNDLLQRKAEHDREQTRIHQQRMKTDAEYRERHSRPPRGSGIGFLGPRKLPPWPLGAKGRIASEFQRTCCHRNVLDALMTVRPGVASELLLAVFIDDQPHEERSDGLERGYGLAFDQEGYPAIYWKSAFYQFLHINPTIALNTLIQLADFCTERWRECAGNKARTDLSHIAVTLADGATKRLYGNGRVYAWSYDRNMHMGHMTAALHALERWLWERCEAGQDITATIDLILEKANSVAFVPVLVNVAKAHPKLFVGRLRQFLAIPEVHFWDFQERQVLAFRFDGFTWWRSGEEIFQIARQWLQMSFRSHSLSEFSLAQQRSDAEFTATMRASLQAWIAVNPAIGNEERAFLAELDSANYVQNADGTYDFAAPAEASTVEHAEPSELDQLRSAAMIGQHILQSRGMLADEQSTTLAGMIDAIDGHRELDAKEKNTGRIALAAALLVKAEGWLDRHPDWYRRCVTAVSGALDGDEHDTVYGRRMRLAGGSILNFSGPAIVTRWLRNPDDPQWSRLLVYFMTSLHEGAVRMVIATAHQNRERLGPKWLRLLEIARLWSALLALKPRFDEDGDNRNWRNWHARLQRLDISATASVPRTEALVDLARRVERLHQLRFRNSSKRGHRERVDTPKRRHLSWGLDTGVLAEAFDWALNWSRSDNAQVDQPSCEVALGVWSFETWRLFEEANREDRLPCQLGYNALDTLGRFAAQADPTLARSYWHPVLSLGAEAHTSTSYFTGAFFARFPDAVNAAHLAGTWRAMLEFVLADSALTEGRHWHDGEKILRDLLGFNAEALIRGLPGSADVVGGLRDLYGSWAARYLVRDDDNITAYAYFLTKPLAVQLRGDGIKQIAQALVARPRRRSDRHARTGETLVELVELALSENAGSRNELRPPILTIVDVLVAQRVPTALALQDRIRRFIRPR